MRKALAALVVLAMLLGLRIEAAGLRASLAAFTDAAAGPGALLESGDWDTATLAVIDDAWTDATPGSENDNFGGQDTMLVEGPNHQAWLQFDVSGIPASATILTAELRLCDTATIAAPVDHALELTIATWSEGAITAANAPGVLGAPSPLTLALTDTTTATCFFADVRAHVQAWVDESVANHGWRVSATTDAIPVAYATKEHSDEALRPELIVNYTQP